MWTIGLKTLTTINSKGFSSPNLVLDSPIILKKSNNDFFLNYRTIWTAKGLLKDCVQCSVCKSLKSISTIVQKTPILLLKKRKEKIK